VAELSNEFELTPMRDSGFAKGFHLGRACAGAYRGEDELGGGLGAEKGLLTRPAVSGGALAGNGAAVELLLPLLCERAEKKKRESGRGQNGGSGRGVPSRPG